MVEPRSGPAFSPGRDAAPSRPKRFYVSATVAEREGGFSLLLDGKSARTPARHDLVLPSAAAAAAVVAEWNAQRETIDPAVMPLTRLSNTAIDGVAKQMRAVAEEVKAYFASDLLVYRAAAPAPLVATEARHWDPVLGWARDTLGARLLLAEGVAFVSQPPASLEALARALDDTVGDDAGSPFTLTAAHVMTTLTGSALLALAVLRHHLSPEAAWEAAHVDETFQEARWGRDDEAAQRRERRFMDMQAAALMARSAGSGPGPA